MCDNTKIILQTRRLYLRELSSSDFSALCRIMQDEKTMYAYEGAFSDKEVQNVVEYLKENSGKITYNEDIQNHVNLNPSAAQASGGADDRDVYFVEAGKFIIEKDKASIGMLQRVFKIGFNRAARIMDQLAEAGVVGEEEGTKPRKVLMSMEEFEQYIEEYV